VGADITERKKLDSALLVAESSLRQLFMSNADGMVVTSPAGEILFVNPAAEELLENKGFDLLGKKFEFSLAPGQRREIVLKSGQADEVVVEVRAVHTKWRRRDAYLASQRDITELVKLRERLRSLSLVDDLTLLYNRRGFVTLARQQIKTANRMGRSLMLFFLDMDDLKAINDNHGHAQGDQAIKEAAMLLKATFRESDILCRFGGDEFLALAMEDGGDAKVIMRRLEQNVEDWSNDAKRPYRLSFSVGAAVYSPAQPQTLEDLVAEADAAMYENKCAKKAALRDPGDPDNAAAG
jgi:diguanylate cyclase (GGDEF)-like protein